MAENKETRAAVGDRRCVGLQISQSALLNESKNFNTANGSLTVLQRDSRSLSQACGSVAADRNQKCCSLFVRLYSKPVVVEFALFKKKIVNFCEELNA